MAESNTRLLIIEDHPIFREGLKFLLAAIPGFEVVGEAEDGASGIERARELQPDIVLMDLSLPQIGGVEATTEIKRLFPGMKVLVLTVYADVEFIRAALEAGADGYVLKDADRAELVAAIHMLMEGKSYLAPAVSETVIQGFVKGKKAPAEGEEDIPLTERELEVLKLVAKGHTNKAIADQLFISIKTVERHRANLMAKLNLRSPQAVTAYAIKKGLIED